MQRIGYLENVLRIVLVFGAQNAHGGTAALFSMIFKTSCGRKLSETNEMSLFRLTLKPSSSSSRNEYATARGLSFAA